LFLLTVQGKFPFVRVTHFFLSLSFNRNPLTLKYKNDEGTSNSENNTREIPEKMAQLPPTDPCGNEKVAENR